MTRAEELALKIFPQNSLEFFRTGLDFNGYRRQGFIKGYEQAKRDFALASEDPELIHTFLYAVKNNKHGAFTFTRLSDEQYREVLNRFNKSKEEK